MTIEVPRTSFTTDYGPGHVDTDGGAFSADAAADVEEGGGEADSATAAILHVHLTNVEPGWWEAAEPAADGRGLQSVGVELTAGECRMLAAELEGFAEEWFAREGERQDQFRIRGEQ